MHAQFNENILMCRVLRQYYQRALSSSLLLLDETAIDLKLDFATLDQIIVDTNCSRWSDKKFNCENSLEMSTKLKFSLKRNENILLLLHNLSS